jgi:TonB family protein
MAAKRPTTNASPLTGSGYGLPRLVTGREHGIKAFFSNFKDFLTERPVKVRNTDQRGAFTDPGFGSGLIENLKEWLRPTPAAARRQIKSGMLVHWQSDTLWKNLRDLISPPKLPPLKVTSKPIPVPEIWSRDPLMKRAQVLSLAVHFLVALLLVVPFLPKLLAPQTTQASNIQVTPLDISPYLNKLPAGPKKAGVGGGGGEHNPIPATKGRLPKFDWTQYTPPLAKPPENPKLAMTPTVLGPPELRLPSPNLPNWGDPLAKNITDSGGPGGGGGIGTSCCGGVGSGDGRGVGPGYGWGTGGGYPGAGTNGYGEPACLYCPSPAFSDEAVKAKYQGVVLLRVVVTPDGRATNIQVVMGLGVGLDEKAVEAVRSWKFRPAIGPNGKPSAVTTLIEVTFRLL